MPNIAAFSLAAIALIVSIPSAAETPPDAVLEEIVVRGELRESSLDDTASSLTVVPLDAERSGWLNHLEQVLNRVPNVNFTSGASRARFFQIRGIGERGQFAEPLNPSVGLLLDGVDVSGIGTAATLFDIEQVEVFRGPQGTLYGANALAGLINVTSRAPTERFTAKVGVGAGNYDAQSADLVVSGPLHEELGVRVAARTYEDDGFIDNEFLGRSDTAGRDEQTVRLRAVWAPAERGTLGVTVGWIDVENGYDNFSLDNNRTTQSDNPGQDKQETVYGSVVWTTRFQTGHELTASLGHASSDIDYGYDEDWTFDGFHPFGYASTDRYLRDRSTTTYDLRVVSPVSTTGRAYEWVAGVFGLTQSVDLDRNYTFLSAPFSSRYDIERYALYGELSIPLSRDWTLRAGLRGEKHNAEYDDTAGSVFSPSDELFGGRVQLERRMTDSVLLYGGIARGYKAGGFNTDGSLDTDLREFEPETLWSVEAGIKRAALNERLSIRGALFYMRRDDVQINTSIVRERPDGSSEFIDFIGNGATGTNYGAEIELDYAASDELAFTAGIGLLDTEFRDYINGEGEDLSGRAQAQSPGHQLHAGVNYSNDSGWYANFSVENRDDYFFSDSHSLESDAHTLLHASLGYRSARWSVQLWGRNLTDEDVDVRGFFFGNDPRDGYAARGFTQLGEPRRFGFSIAVEWQ